MPHFTKLSGRVFAECLMADGWSCKKWSDDGGPQKFARLNKAGKKSIHLTLLYIYPLKNIKAFCRTAGISAEKLEELQRATVAATKN